MVRAQTATATTSAAATSTADAMSAADVTSTAGATSTADTTSAADATSAGVSAAEASKEKLEWKDVFELTEWFRPGTIKRADNFDPTKM